MPEISKIKLPSGTVYDIKDSVAREMISGGVSFIVAWDGTSTPVPANIPAGVQVVYNSTTYTGTLDADNAQPGAFYLVHSSTVTSEGPLDIYDEYVPVGLSGSSEKSWEKIGDTQVDLSNVVTNVGLNKSTATVIGSSATFTTDKVIGSDVTFTTDSVIGADATFTITQPTIALATDSSSGTGKVQLATDASASSTDTVIGSDATFTTSKAVASVSAETNKSLVVTSIYPVQDSTTSVTGVKSNTTTASKASAASASSVSRASQTTADGTDTRKDANASVLPADTGSTPSANDYILRRIGVNDEVLIIGSVELDTQTTYSVSSLSTVNFSDVTVPIKADSATTVPIKGAATTVATGSTDENGTGAAVVTGVTVGSQIDAVTGWNSKDTVTAVTGVSASKTYIKATASGANTAWNDKDTVAAVTGINSKDEVTAVTGWNSKDQKTVLDNNTSITVTKGNE